MIPYIWSIPALPSSSCTPIRSAPMRVRPTFWSDSPSGFTQGRKATDVPGATDGLSDGVFMSSRDGLHFRRWAEAFVRPGPQADNWVSRNNYIAKGVVVTGFPIWWRPPDELSIYVIEGYYSVSSNRCRLRRHTITDGRLRLGSGALQRWRARHQARRVRGEDIGDETTRPSAAGSVSVETADRVRKSPSTASPWATAERSTATRSKRVVFLEGQFGPEQAGWHAGAAEVCDQGTAICNSIRFPAVRVELGRPFSPELAVAAGGQSCCSHRD